MSAKFVSAGGEDVKPREGLSEYDGDAWEKARQKIEELKKPQQEAPGTQEGGKSLYEHLQAQKAAKQEAYEEATKLRNQFRPLDDSEVEFLESIRRRELAEATNVRQETEEQLATFRREREAAEEKARELEASRETSQIPADEVLETWATTKKRRRADIDDKAGSSKSLKTSTNVANAQSPPPPPPPPTADQVLPAMKGTTTSKTDMPSGIPKLSQDTSTKPAMSKPTATLVAYDSDSDD